MEFLHAGVEREYRRWIDLAGPDDPYSSQETIGLHEVLCAHFLVIDYFAEKNYGIGGIGPRNLDLLHSALSRQFTGYDGKRKWSGVYENCATLLFGLVMNHAFHDANKRTALLTALWLLTKRKLLVTLPQKRLDGLVIAIASHQLESYFARDARFQKRAQELSHSRGDDDLVLLVAEFLNKNTRKRDDSFRSVTYNELNRALKRHGYELRHPNGNYINVVRIEPAVPAKLFGLGAKPEREVFLAQIGFPGWKDQVHRAALKTVREATRLNSANGCDTQVLFQEAEPLNSLIAEYSEPLKRLANK